MLKYLSLVLMVTASSSFAGALESDFANEFTSVDTALDFKKVPGQTKYETLLESYKTASAPAELKDFPDYKAAQALTKGNCIIVSPGQPNQVTGIYARTAELVAKGKPGNGPLFPPTEDRVEQKLVAGWAAKTSYSDAALRVFQMSQSETDLVIYVPKNKLGVWNDTNLPTMMSVRKKENYMPFIVQSVDSERKPVKMLYAGYCF